MSLYDKDIENCFMPYLQQSVCFIIGDKVIKSGKLLLFKQEDYHIHLSLQDIKTLKIRNFELPYPFRVEYWQNDNILYLDYRNQSLIQDKKINEKINKEFLKIGKKNRFYDKILELKCC